MEGVLGEFLFFFVSFERFLFRFCVSFIGSRSSGFNRSGSDRRKEKDSKIGDSKSGGSGSESDYTIRSSLRGSRERAFSERSGFVVSEYSYRGYYSLVSSLRSYYTYSSYGSFGVFFFYGFFMLMMFLSFVVMGFFGVFSGRDLVFVFFELIVSR